MEWTRSETIGLASLRCPHCGGLGLVRGTQGMNAPCPCVLRKIFRVCWNRYRFGQLEQIERGAPIVNVNRLGRQAQSQPGRFSFTLENYLADFILTVRRTLSADELAFFNTAYLSGVDWARAHGPLNMDRSRFVHVCYRLEAKLGRAFRETQPFALFPLEVYFSRPAPGSRTVPFAATGPARYQPLVPPMAQRQPMKRAA